MNEKCEVSTKRGNMKQWKIGSLFILLGIFLVACSASSNTGEVGSVGQAVPVEGGGEYTDITPQDLNVMMSNKDFFFVNVHIPYEGEIPNTDAFVAFDEIKSRLTEFPAETDAKIVIYCRSGSMSATAAKSLVESGYTNVFNLDGGFRAWAQAGYEFIQ
ncbi:MAG: rhodanese-like domain-containing protein [Candidatus Hermodarchaeia archaeon]